MDDLTKLIKSLNGQWITYPYTEQETKRSLSKNKTDETIEQFLPFHGHLYVNDLGTWTLSAFEKGTKYKNSKGKQKRRKENSVQLKPAPKMGSM